MNFSFVAVIPFKSPPVLLFTASVTGKRFLNETSCTAGQTHKIIRLFILTMGIEIAAEANTAVIIFSIVFCIKKFPATTKCSGMEKFFDFIRQLTSLSKESEEALSGILQKMELPKGYDLLKPGSICRHFYFIESGLTRTYYIKKGKDVTDWLSPENSFAVSIVSFITHLPDRRGIELLEPSVLWAVSNQGIETLYKQYHDIERLGRLIISHGIVQMQQRFDDLHFATAAERYRKLIAIHPSLINRVPLGMIASYLGITQETLSRVRASHP